jgi:predicted transcriptional regulator
VKEFVSSKDISRRVTIYPDDKAINILFGYEVIVDKTTPIEVRLEKILLKTGEVEILITSILDEEKLSNKEMGELYHKRWGIETNIGKEKNILQLEHFSSHLKNGIKQDFYATLIANNIHSIIVNETNKKVNQKTKKRKYEYRVNESASINKFKSSLIKIFYTKNLKQLVNEMQSIFELFIEPVRPNRNVERKRFCKRRYGKHQTHTNYRNNM